MIRRGSAVWAATTSAGIISLRRGGFAAGSGEGAVIPTRAEVALRSAWSRALWLLTGGLAVVAAALWLRTPSVPYLVVCAAATAITLAVGFGVGAPRRWLVAFATAMAAFVASAAIAERSSARIEQAWDSYRTEAEDPKHTSELQSAC